MSTLKSSDLVADAILDFIAVYESAGNYNAVIGDAKATYDLSLRTIDGIYDLQSKLLSAGRPSTAVGRYQIVKATLRSLVAVCNISASELFTPEMQDALGLTLLNRRGYSDWRAGVIDDVEFAYRLSLEWASLPDPKKGGKSHYDGVGPNHAGTTLDAVYAMLRQARSLPAPTPDPAPIPASTPISSDVQRLREILTEALAISERLG